MLKYRTKWPKSFYQKMKQFRFNPNQGFKLRWDILVIILSVYNALVTPQQFAMTQTYENLTLIKYVDAAVDTIFALDILIMFRTSYRDPERDLFIEDSKLIAINYIKGRFLIDFLASFPFDLFL